MKVGEIYTDRFSFNQKELTDFCNLVGDVNQIHRDIQVAKEQGYVNCLVQGIFAVAVFSVHASNLMPSFIKAIECSRNTQFIRPVFVDEEVLLSCEIIDLYPDKGIGIVREKIKNSKGQICIDSIVETKILEKV